MKPSALRMRAISRFVRDAGTTTSVWRARDALRTRVSMSAIGSEMFMRPYQLDLVTPGSSPIEGALAEADAAQVEAAHVRARPAADDAAVVSPDAELRLPLCLGDQRLLGHLFLPAYEAKGMPRSSSRRFDSSSDFAVVTMLISSPRRRSTLS